MLAQLCLPANMLSKQILDKANHAEKIMHSKVVREALPKPQFKEYYGIFCNVILL